jgi:hypothetical protein
MAARRGTVQPAEIGTDYRGVLLKFQNLEITFLLILMIGRNLAASEWDGHLRCG